MDASFEKIESIRPHCNADKLELATIAGWQVVVGKGQFKVNDVVFYVREDAKLLESDRAADYMSKNATKDLTGFEWKWPWQSKLLQYLGSGGRVKTIRLRGEWSSGIAIALSDLSAHLKQENLNWEDDDKKLNSESSAAFLMEKYGISHWEAPVRNAGDLKILGGLPYSIPKSDEANVQELRKNSSIPFGAKCLVTKKLDGTSTTIVAFPDGRTHVCTRSNDLDKESDNVWNRAAKDVLPLAEAWAKHYNKPIALRGETCAKSIQNFKFNKDKDVQVPTFYCYGVIMLDEKNYYVRNGQYGTPYHFLKIAEQIKELTGKELKTVPVLGESVVTEELISEYLNKPLDFGEGVVLNTEPQPTKDSHFKIKSLAYLEAISKQCS